MKISSGSLAGRSIAQPKTDKTRPVSEKTRHAIFQTLGDVEGLAILDLFAGSGALGLESLSLGARSCIFVDSAKIAVDTIRHNLRELGLDKRAEVVAKKAETFLLTNVVKFDLVFYDPPYAEFAAEKLQAVSWQLKPNGIIVVSCSSKTGLPETIAGLELVKQKIYGDTQIAYFRFAN